MKPNHEAHHKDLHRTEAYVAGLEGLPHGMDVIAGMVNCPSYRTQSEDPSGPLLPFRFKTALHSSAPIELNTVKPPKSRKNVARRSARVPCFSPIPPSRKHLIRVSAFLHVVLL